MLNKLAAIIRKDITLRFEGRAELLFFLILPIIFTYLIGGGFADMGDNRTNVPVVNEDGGARAEAFLAALAASDTIEPVVRTRSEAEELLAGNDVLKTAPGSNVGLVVEQEVARAAGEIAQPLLVARNAVEGVEAARPFAGDAEREAFFRGTLAAAESALPAQPPRVEYTVPSGGGTYDQRSQASAGQLMTWVFIPLLAVSGLFAGERVLGTLRRLMITPTRKSTFLTGTISGQLILALVQMAILIAFGILVMHVPWGRDPVALIVVLVSLALAGLALGTTLGTFVKTESQASNLSIMLGMSMALLGGAWFPMELFPPGLQQAVKILPTTWAMSALTDITMRGQGLVDILPEAAVLLGFAVVFFIIGIRRFRYE